MMTLEVSLVPVLVRIAGGLGVRIYRQLFEQYQVLPVMRLRRLMSDTHVRY